MVIVRDVLLNRWQKIVTPPGKKRILSNGPNREHESIQCDYRSFT